MSSPNIIKKSNNIEVQLENGDPIEEIEDQDLNSSLLPG